MTDTPESFVKRVLPDSFLLEYGPDFAKRYQICAKNRAPALVTGQKDATTAWLKAARLLGWSTV